MELLYGISRICITSRVLLSTLASEIPAETYEGQNMKNIMPMQPYLVLDTTDYQVKKK